jgi:hypothetical protein
MFLEQQIGHESDQPWAAAKPDVPTWRNVENARLEESNEWYWNHQDNNQPGDG